MLIGGAVVASVLDDGGTVSRRSSCDIHAFETLSVLDGVVARCNIGECEILANGGIASACLEGGVVGRTIADNANALARCRTLDLVYSCQAGCQALLALRPIDRLAHGATTGSQQYQRQTALPRDLTHKNLSETLAQTPLPITKGGPRLAQI
jgi:hypothetical protein